MLDYESARLLSLSLIASSDYGEFRIFILAIKGIFEYVSARLREVPIMNVREYGDFRLLARSIKAKFECGRARLWRVPIVRVTDKKSGTLTNGHPHNRNSQ